MTMAAFPRPDQSRGLPLPVSAYPPLLCPDTVLTSPSRLGFFCMQTTTDDRDGGNLKNNLMHNPSSNNSNTWCSDDGDGDGTCSSGGCDGVQRPRPVA